MKEENRCLWMIKGIACLIVILFHCPIPTAIGDAIIYGLRFPIPIFLMISGYFSVGKESSFLKSAFKTIKLLFFGELISLLVLEALFLTGLSHTNPISILQQINWAKTIFYGSIFNGTLWYLYAMFWTWILFFVVSKLKHGFTILQYLTIPLLALHIGGRMYITINFDINQSVFLFRSTILFAVPFMMIGRIIAEKKDIILHKTIDLHILMIMALGLSLIVIEYILWH